MQVAKFIVYIVKFEEKFFILYVVVIEVEFLEKSFVVDFVEVVIIGLFIDLVLSIAVVRVEVVAFFGDVGCDYLFFVDVLPLNAS